MSRGEVCAGDGRAAESPRPGRGLHRRGRGCEKTGSEQDGEDLGEGQPAEEGKQIGREGVKGGMAAHGRVLAVGAGQQVGIGGSLNAGDGQLQQDVPEDDGPAAGLPGAPVQQGGVQQALGNEIDDADE